MTIEQCRAARALLNWSTSELAKRAGIGVATVKRFEGGQPVQDNSIGAMEVAFEYAGVVLIASGAPSKAAGPGARLLRDPS